MVTIGGCGHETVHIFLQRHLPAGLITLWTAGVPVPACTVRLAAQHIGDVSSVECGTTDEFGRRYVGLEWVIGEVYLRCSLTASRTLSTREDMFPATALMILMTDTRFDTMVTPTETKQCYTNWTRIWMVLPFSVPSYFCLLFIALLKQLD